MSRLAVVDLDALAAMGGRLAGSPGAVADAAGRLVTAAGQLQDEAMAEVRGRRATLDHADPDEVPRLRARLARAEEASAVAATLVREASELAVRIRAVAGDASGHGTRRLARIEAEVRSIEAPATFDPAGGLEAAGAGSGGGGAGGDGGGAPPEGSLPGDTPGSVYDALWEYSEEPGGRAFNDRARRHRSTPDDERLRAALDDGFARTVPLRADTTFERMLSPDFYPALNRTATTPERVLDALDSGAALHDPGYVSAATPGGTFPPGTIRAVLHVPAGTPVIDMERMRPGTGRPLTAKAGEHEWLLPRGAYVWTAPGTASYDPAIRAYRVHMYYKRYGA